MAFLVLAVVSFIIPSVLGHGFISEAGTRGTQLAKAQKTNLKSTFFRAVSDNTGWIGSDHLNSPAITCGMSTTPFKTNAAPSGRVFADAEESAGQTHSIQAGQTFQVVVSGNPGVGWPHRNGDIATYLGFCGDSATACQNFDASTAEYFKIQEAVGGIQSKLISAYDPSVDGNRWDIPIPTNIKSGSYILRYELITFGQSSAAEGHQDQYYPFCGQINVQNGQASANNFDTVTFPGAYNNGNIDASKPPGPQALAVGSSTTSVPGSSGKGSSGGSRSHCSSKHSRRNAKRAAKRAAILASHASKRSMKH